MKTVLERFLEYVKFDTQSNDSTGTHPSTPGQTVFARLLADEMRKLGVENVRVSEYVYVFGELPPTPGMEKVPALGAISTPENTPWKYHWLPFRNLHPPFRKRILAPDDTEKS